MKAALPGQADPSQLRARIELTRKARPTMELLLPTGNPQRVVQDYLLVLLNPNSQLSVFMSWSKMPTRVVVPPRSIPMLVQFCSGIISPPVALVVFDPKLRRQSDRRRHEGWWCAG